ncbi:MAG: M24 family metallopeptidase [Candidatus Flexifilum sp.]|jgi:Xaa-Pro aminopeptidase
MHQEQRLRARSFLKERKIDSALFAHPETVAWLTGYQPPLDMGLHHFNGGAAVVWMDADGQFTLIVQDTLREYAGQLDYEPDCSVRTYETYTIDAPIRSAENMAELLKKVVRESPKPKKCGIEYQSVNGHQTEAMISVYMLANFYVHIDGWLKPLRMVKTEEEIADLRRAFALADLGLAVARRETAVGKREIDVWMAIQTAINAETGRRTPLGNDCVVGYRQNNIGGWPRDLVLRPGDDLIVDLSAAHNGYWSDSCMTFYAGEPTEAQRKLHRFIREALDYAISLVKPGVLASAIDSQVREFIRRGGYPVYPHHTGHGVGAGLHEEPRIVPYNDIPLEAGMVLMLEPGVYFPGEYGCRMEDGILVTADGAERLTHFDKGM